jgi:hypothetical protein
MAALDDAKEPITTVILRNGLGGDSWSARRIADVIQKRHMRTAVSTMCWSACYFIFLGGVERQFTDERPEHSFLGFHAQYDVNVPVGPMLGLALRWILDHTDGKADPALFERMKELNYRGAIVFFPPGNVGNVEDISVFLCRGFEHHIGTDCEKIRGTNAHKQGVVTSKELVHANDMPPRSDSGDDLWVAGDQIVISGTLKPGIDRRFLRLLDQSATTIRTVVLRNSWYGNLDAAQTIGAAVRAHGLRTALSGYCAEACAYVFLSGVERLITDEKPLDTILVLSGEYRDGELQPAELPKWKRWVLELTGGRADPALLDRMQEIQTPAGGIYFFQPEHVKNSEGRTVFFCRGDHKLIGRDCETIRGPNGYAQGIFTSKEPVKVNRIAPAASGGGK